MTKRMQKDDDPTLASLAGETFALIQHGIDLGIEWGFSRLKDAASTAPAAKTQAKTATGKLASAGRGILNFMGQAGEAYYKSYSELKKKH